MPVREPHLSANGSATAPVVPFQRLALAAAVSGVAAGLLFTLIQQWLLVPSILQAEVLELGHDSHTVGTLRMVLTLVFNCLAGFGYGLLLAVGMSLRQHRGWLHGLAWGSAGWLCFSLAPALGLPPELPGGPAAPLGVRQLWWLYAAAGTAVGLTLAIFGRTRLWRLAGVLLAGLPHVAGAPGAGWLGLPPVARLFAVGALGAAAVFWLTLGAGLGLVFARRPVS
jgi:cobalt transporter subunit CbtA